MAQEATQAPTGQHEANKGLVRWLKGPTADKQPTPAAEGTIR